MYPLQRFSDIRARFRHSLQHDRGGAAAAGTAGAMSLPEADGCSTSQPRSRHPPRSAALSASASVVCASLPLLRRRGGGGGTSLRAPVARRGLRLLHQSAASWPPRLPLTVGYIAGLCWGYGKIDSSVQGRRTEIRC